MNAPPVGLRSGGGALAIGAELGRGGEATIYALADEHISCVIADMLEHASEPRRGEGT